MSQRVSDWNGVTSRFGHPQYHKLGPKMQKPFENKTKAFLKLQFG
jgi:hypothetical protein